jgi:hypothetical protein
MGEDGSLQVLEGLARLQPELLGQHISRLPVALQRVGLAARAVEREHQLCPQPFPQRMLGDECLELADDHVVTSEGKVGVEPLLHDREPQLLESADLRLRERLICAVGEGRPTPNRKGRSKQLGGLSRTPARKRVAPVPKESLASSSIQLIRRENQCVAACPALQTRCTERRAQA